MRVENVKGAVWTVDDEEYYKRRPPRGVGASASPNTNQSPTLTPQTPSIIDQVSQNIFIFTSTRISKISLKFWSLDTYFIQKLTLLA